MKIGRVFRIFGPAWLVMLADMDALSIIGAAQAGAVYSYGFVWLMLVLILPLYVIQEVSGRIGAITKEGLGTVIRKNYSKDIALLMTVPMALSDVITYVGEYVGIAVGLDILGVPLYLGIPCAFVLYLVIVSRKDYSYIEKILIGISLVLIVGLFATLLLRGIKPYSIFYFSLTPSYMLLFAATIGAVIMPFMLFFQASATAYKLKEEKPDDIGKAIKEVKENTLIGAIVTELLMAIVEMTFTGISGAARSSVFASPHDLSEVMTPFVGAYAPYVFAIGLIGAGFLALNVVSLGSAWGLAEAANIKRKKLVYVMESLPAVIVAMLTPPRFLINAVLGLLVAFVFVLVGPLIVLGIIGKNKTLMGAHALTRMEQLVYWTTSIIIVGMAAFAALLSM